MNLASTPPMIIWQSPEQQISPADRIKIECAKAWQRFVNKNPVKADGNVQGIYLSFMESCIESQEAIK